MTTSISDNSKALSSTNGIKNNDDNNSVIHVIVVGRNRTRLTKIMSLVQQLEIEMEQTRQHQLDKDNINNTAEKQQPHEYLPCLAAMDSYEAPEGGKMITYMSNFVVLDGSPMTEYLDNEEFRQTLKLVLLVGYEWNEMEDLNHIQNYFQINQLDCENIVFECVSPNNKFVSLQDEMQYFKNLDEDEKALQCTKQDLGPWKMARFVVDKLQALTFQLMGKQPDQEIEETLGRIETDNNKTDNATFSDGDHIQDCDTNETTTKTVLRIDPSVPIFACRICRTPLLDENHLAESHAQNLHSFKRRSAFSSSSSSSSSKHRQQPVPCQSLFCDESVLAWLSPSDGQVEGRLQCYKCSNKLGHWNWSGAQCSCGTWVVPAIQIPISKVDTILPQSSSAAGPDATSTGAAVVVMPKIFS